jgi:type VI secretion system secreted protein Hcp
MANVDYFLKIDGVEGESTREGHAGEIEVESLSWGESNRAGAAHGAGGGAGKVSMQDFHFTLPSGKSSPTLLLACASGQHLKEAILIGMRAGGDKPQPFLKYRLTDVLISSYQIAGDPPTEDRPADTVNLNFARIELDYYTQMPDGSSGPAVHFGWDLKQNKAV